MEARLGEQEGIDRVGVIVREDTADDRRLVAYYTGAGGEGEAGAESLRAHLGARLPGYMVPAVYVRVEAWPLTRNGKVDRKRLPVPEADAYPVSGYEEPVGGIEELLAGDLGGVR